MNILTGRFKGRVITFHPEPDLRPTHNKIRKAVADAFAGWVGGVRVLDLYSGTGALGMELLSAGAASALFIERNPARARLIAQWLEAAGLKTDCAVRAEEAFHAVARLEKAGERFDLAILDPPYEDAQAPRILDRLAGLLERESFVVYECRSTAEAPPAAGLEKIRDRIYGDTRLVVYRKTVEA